MHLRLKDPHALSKRKQLLCLLLGLGSLMACSQKLIHSDLHYDPEVLTQSWALSTHEPSWIGDHGVENSNILLVGKTLFMGSRTQGLLAFYPEFKKRRWMLDLPKGVQSEITADGDFLYFAGGDGYFYCVSQETGQVQWKFLLKTPFASRPFVYRGRVLVNTSDDLLYAFEVRSGKNLWVYRRRTPYPMPKIYGASQPWVEGNEVIVGWSDGYLSGLDFEEGRLLWEKKIHPGGKFLDVNAQVVLDQEIFYIPSYDGALYALHRKDRQPLWRFDAGGAKSVVVDQGSLFLPSSDGSVYSLQKETARMNWKFVLDRGVPSHLVVTSDRVIFGSSQNFLYVLRKEDGQPLFRYNVGAGSGWTSSPVFDVSKKVLYFLSHGGNLHRFYIPRDVPSKPRGRTRPHQFVL